MKSYIVKTLLECQKRFEQDKAALSQTMIIIGGFVIAAIVILAGIAGVSLTKGEESARCISEFSTFDSGANKNDCSIAASDNNGTLPPGENENATPGEPIEKEEENSLVEYTPDECFEMNGTTLVKYLIAENPIQCTKDVVIPEKVEGNTVEAIGAAAFIDGTLLKFTDEGLPIYEHAINSVIIPDSVKEVGDTAFTYNNLTYLKLSNSTERIGTGAFAYNKLTEVVVPESVNFIGNMSFQMNRLEKIEWNHPVESMGSHVFSYNQLKYVKIPEGVATVPVASFLDNQLISIDIPSSVATIGEGAFLNNKLLEVKIPTRTTIKSPTSLDGSFDSNVQITRY